MSDQLPDQLHLRGVDPLQGQTLIVRKRDGRNEEFNEARIYLAIESAFKAVGDLGQDEPSPDHLQIAVKRCADVVVERVLGRAVRGEQMEVEFIQDAVEEQLMLQGYFAVARCYILYREKRRVARAERDARGRSAKVIPPPPDSGESSVTGPIAPPPAALKRDTPRAHSQTHSLLKTIYSQALPGWRGSEELEPVYRAHFSAYLNEGHYLRRLTPELLDFDLPLLADALRVERDEQFLLAGLETLYDDFLLQDNGRRIETPQYFWMRLAMGLALNEGGSRHARAVEFYEALSTFRFVPSELVLANAGTVHPYLVNCCSITSWGDLEHVTAQAEGRPKNQKKRGAACSWLEPWHIDIRDFLVRPREGSSSWNGDLNKGLWMPDLFMERVSQNGRWTLFDPRDVPDLHSHFGRAFEERYLEYECRAERGEMNVSRQINAVDLWREIMSSCSVTGQPWIGFKDAVNLRSADCGSEVVRFADLGATVLLNSPSHGPTGCMLGAINLAAHLGADASQPLNNPLLQKTISTAMRMLDNAIDISFYPSGDAQAFCHGNRAAGLGLLGFDDALDHFGIPYASGAAIEFADQSMEMISHTALLSSSALAAERGAYPNYPGSKWSRGILPMDTLSALAAQRGGSLEMDNSARQNWRVVRESLRRNGLRHGTLTAISPTDVVAKIVAASPSIEPSLSLQTGGSGWCGIYQTAFEMTSSALIDCASRRQKWLDMSQALSLYSGEHDLAGLGELYFQAWRKGLKTIGQLRPLGGPVSSRPPDFQAMPVITPSARLADGGEDFLAVNRVKLF